jgi:hypothetical protein
VGRHSTRADLGRRHATIEKGRREAPFFLLRRGSGYRFFAAFFFAPLAAFFAI